ncbi:S41 family peptidase [Thermoflexibacter ruber]|uniref:C-terminal processing peptidase-3. Serine peptidase. MEROPS family S41A n=1 Tax=Thermoflexibacter ruber TaxID=1003 RepID=A0A1I2I0V5_9BACT|nr:S41 family peptidase [Thermoflexibacter ruber]SFF34697.1 C-terminal processing peptidase-3. Serine peptidase. MEROPS family S41A [Thermoflexibacter ruber]
MKKKTLYLFIAASLSLLVAYNSPDDHYFEVMKNLEIFGSLFKEVNTYYVDEISPNELMNEGINSMLNSLDPYTNYIPEDQIEDYRIMTTGQYAGIGIETITREDGKTLITKPMKGFVGEKSGLLIGDQILKIDGIDVTTKNGNEISHLLKGQAGSPIEVVVKRFGSDKPLTFKMVREKISTTNVPYFGMVSNEVGLIQLTDFTYNASKEVKDALLKLKEQGAKNIILDLRDNPGGLLGEAVNISNLFVPKGSEIVSTKGKVKEWNKKYNALNNALDTDIPLTVLINSSSASAAEIVCGVIQDYDRGVLIGQNSFGKGLVQVTRSLSYNSKLKVTVAKYYIPSGRCIQAVDYSNRNPDGSVGKVPDSLRVAFKTKIGRVVYDGGGVKPDIENEKPHVPQILSVMLRKGLIFDYATEFRVKNASIAPAKEFKLSDAQYQDFVKWLANKDLDYKTRVERTIESLEKTAKEEKYYDDIKPQLNTLKDKLFHNKDNDLQKFKSEIKEELEKEIASRYYFADGRMEASFDDDPDIKAALALFKDESKYKKILSK